MTLEYTAHPVICRPDASAALYKTALSREDPFGLYRRYRSGQTIFVCLLEKTSSNIFGFKYGRCIYNVSCRLQEVVRLVLVRQ